MRYIQTPFATSGDRDEIPMAAQPSGSVSYPQGYGSLYSEDPDTNPEARRIERRLFNGALYDTTTAIKAWQDQAFPDWFAASDRGPVGYPLGAIVRGPTGTLYASRVTNNQDALTVAASWRAITFDAASDTAPGFLRLATEAESAAGTSSTVAMSPLRVAQRIAAAVANLVTGQQLTTAITAYDATLGSLAKANSVNNGNWSGTALAVNNGGTGATTAGGARSNLGLANGATTQITVSATTPSGGTDGDLWFQL